MEIMGVKVEDLREDLISECGAVGTFIQEARESRVSLFI
jgi:peroxiredoxin family protein